MVLTINGIQREVTAADDADLLSVLRNELDLTGSKYGCGEGACGACMVLIDGKAMPSCVASLGSLTGKKIITIEGLENKGILHKVQEAFIKTDPFQCSSCASGMIIASVGLLSENPKPDDEAIKEFMNRNICRCGTYFNIIEAIKLASIS